MRKTWRKRRDKEMKREGKESEIMEKSKEIEEEVEIEIGLFTRNVSLKSGMK